MPEADARSDLALLIDAARAAGRIAVKHWRADPETWDKADGAGPVTEADLEVDAMLHAELLAARPDYGWLSEETADTPERLQADRVFVVDPIDGTRSFIAGQRTFAHALTVVEQGRPVAGVVYLPLRDKLYAAALGYGATLNGAPITTSARSQPGGASMLAAKPNFAPEHWGGTPPDLARHFRTSLAYRVSLVAEGRFDAMMTIRDAWEWDIAAGCLIAAEAGARVTDRLGAPLVFNSPGAKTPGALVANPVLHENLRAAMTLAS
ncbi:3'(2'),5'-bisphosphate nucleotidase CysQ [Tropicimonas sp. S265A]|uniref:3'(2'),5'-bisphosphate nucleotidase CysQ n=1 Tax=Tropicimonas sp. S265A TaxID=3415134 RepID=UPI003C7C17A6